MPLLLPNLDDRTWADLVDEGRSLIPVYGPEWTDHNVHDPGITIMELLAWIAEMDIYRLNQIGDEARRKFLALIGVRPQPAHAATTILGFRLNSGVAPLTLPPGLEFTEATSVAVSAPFRTLKKITLAPGQIEALQFKDETGFHNLTNTWRRGNSMKLLGGSPKPGVEFYLGLSDALPIGIPISIVFTFADGASGHERQRAYQSEVADARLDCLPWINPCANDGLPGDANADSPVSLQHYGVRLAWEYVTEIDGRPVWIEFKQGPDEITDETRAFTFDGAVEVQLPAAISPLVLGSVPAPLYYLRCRMVAGRYDDVPLLRQVTFNGVAAEQAVAEKMVPLLIEADAAISYSSAGPPQPNDHTSLKLSLNDRGRVSELQFGGGEASDPQFPVLDYREPAAGNPGLLNLEVVLLGDGNGLPRQTFNLPHAPIERFTLHVYTLEDSKWQEWKGQCDFDASRRTSNDYQIDATGEAINFGDGENGRVPPAGCLIFATYRSTQADLGNVAAGLVNRLSESDHNRALLYDPAVPDPLAQLKSQLNSVTNSIAATGGAAAESSLQSMVRADRLVSSSERAVTLPDYERLAMQTPGTRIARVTARANLHPSFPCFEATGVITVIVLPFLPAGGPVPSAGLLRAVGAYLNRRRIIGTRVEVIGPTYLEIAVRATIQPKREANRVDLQAAIVARLNQFLDPLIGGPDGTGWPFGRDVYRAEIMRVIDEVAGVDHVDSIELFGPGCEAQCGDVCLGPTWLVTAGQHEIKVL
ncbi:MAG TPA: putative baseplate assembly protein [Pyrinomonadaceae bacterium]|jgi:hypothetical protein|nr:putative baseplate assembly protein [Pyrinomonadaceae bacterium]